MFRAHSELMADGIIDCHDKMSALQTALAETDDLIAIAVTHRQAVLDAIEAKRHG